MNFTIKYDKLVSAGHKLAHVETAKKSGLIEPKFLVLHYTASDNYEADVRTLSRPGRAASAHLVVAPDGSLTQIGNFTDGLWHAGKSAWRGYVGLNDDSIGIEVTCPGPLDGDQARYGKKLKEGEPYEFTMAAHKHGGPARKWAIFTDAQISIVEEVGLLLMWYYDLKEAVGHDDISPGRKIDPGPSCPVSLLQFLNGERADEPIIERPELLPVGLLRVTGVAPETLTFRATPNGEKRGELPEKTIVEEISRQGNWVQVRTLAAHVGWVYGKFVQDSDR